MSEFSHKGHKIVYREDTNDWRCDDLDLVAGSLKLMRDAIDKFSVSERKMSVPVIMIDQPNRGWGSWSPSPPKLADATVTIICEPRGHTRREAWILKGGKREKVAIETLFPVSARAQLVSWLELQRAADDAHKQAEKVLGAIVTYTAETLKAASK